MGVRDADIGLWNGETVAAGESLNFQLKVTERRSGAPVRIPIHVRRATQPGPAVCVTGALHGDEINGTGAIQHLLMDPEFELTSGTLVAVPVLNILGFERHSRYLPDRRDLNRSFPGTSRGSLAGRMAHKIFSKIITRCDYGVDLHTAAVRRTNYPNVRGDLTNPEVVKIAKAFGSEITMTGFGPPGSLRRESTLAGVPMIIMEGGEASKVEPFIVDAAVSGIRNVLRYLKMLDGEPELPKRSFFVEKSQWLRSDRGGFLQFHIAPGDVVLKDQPIASNLSLLGEHRVSILCPYDAIVIGMTTTPTVSPGEPICHLGVLSPQDMKDIGQAESM